jgi:hypothetical protein
MKFRFAIMIWLLVISACSTPQSTSAQDEPTPFAYPHDEPAMIPTSTMTVVAFSQEEPAIIPTATMSDQQLINACVETITKFMQSNPCKDWDAYHALLSPKSYEYKATPMAENDPACDMKESVKILQILPVEEWWQMGNNGKDLPGDLHPVQPGELVFYVETETTWRTQGVTSPTVSNMIMRMLPENGKCLMRTFGWG